MCLSHIASNVLDERDCGDPIRLQIPSGARIIADRSAVPAVSTALEAARPIGLLDRSLSATALSALEHNSSESTRCEYGEAESVS